MNNRRKSLFKFFGTLAAVLTLVVGIAAVLSARSDTVPSTPPPPPPWVSPDGTVDLSKVPDRMGVVDRNGQHVGYVDGKDLLGPPPPLGTAPLDPGTPVRSDEDGRIIGYLVPMKGFVAIQ